MAEEFKSSQETKIRELLDGCAKEISSTLAAKWLVMERHEKSRAEHKWKMIEADQVATHKKDFWKQNFLRSNKWLNEMQNKFERA